MAVNVNNDHSRAAFFNFTVLSLGKIIRYIIPREGAGRGGCCLLSANSTSGGGGGGAHVC